MKIEDVLILESKNAGCINLAQDRLFWQAYEKSAYLFCEHFKKYQVRRKFFKNVGQDVLLLGFPKTALPEIEKIALGRGYEVERKTETLIKIKGLPPTSGYEEWRSSIPGAGSGSPPQAAAAAPNRFLPAYKTAYDLCLHTHRATARMAKEFRYELGARVRGHAADLMEVLHLMVNNAGHLAVAGEAYEVCESSIQRLRINLRLIKDLAQISIEQWGFLSKQIETLQNLLRAEFRNSNSRLAEEATIQSGGTLTPSEHHSRSSASIKNRHRDSLFSEASL